MTPRSGVKVAIHVDDDYHGRATQTFLELSGPARPIRRSLGKFCKSASSDSKKGVDVDAPEVPVA